MLWACGAGVRVKRRTRKAIRANHFIAKNSTEIKLSDFAILYRGNHQANAGRSLRTARLPYKCRADKAFLTRRNQDVCLLAFAQQSENDLRSSVAITTPKRGIGESTLNRLNDLPVIKLSLYQRHKNRALVYLGKQSQARLQVFMLNVSAWNQSVCKPAGDFACLARYHQI